MHPQWESVTGGRNKWWKWLEVLQWRKEQISTREADSHFLSSTIKHLLWILYIFHFRKKEKKKLDIVKMSPCSTRERAVTVCHTFFPISRLLPETLGAGGSDMSAEITGRFSSVLFINIKVDTGRGGLIGCQGRPESSTGTCPNIKPFLAIKPNSLKKKSVNVKCRRQNNSEVWNIYSKTWKIDEL